MVWKLLFSQVDFCFMKMFGYGDEDEILLKYNFSMNFLTII